MKGYCLPITAQGIFTRITGLAVLLMGQEKFIGLILCNHP